MIWHGKSPFLHSPARNPALAAATAAAMVLAGTTAFVSSLFSPARFYLDLTRNRSMLAENLNNNTSSTSVHRAEMEYHRGEMLKHQPQIHTVDDMHRQTLFPTGI